MNADDAGKSGEILSQAEDSDAKNMAALRALFKNKYVLLTPRVTEAERSGQAPSR